MCSYALVAACAWESCLSSGSRGHATHVSRALCAVRAFRRANGRIINCNSYYIALLALAFRLLAFGAVVATEPGVRLETPHPAPHEAPPRALSTHAAERACPGCSRPARTQGQAVTCADSGAHCDSSDCLFCQGLSHSPFGSEQLRERLCSTLGKRPCTPQQQQQPCSSPDSESDSESDEEELCTSQRKRARQRMARCGSTHSLGSGLASRPCQDHSEGHKHAHSSSCSRRQRWGGEQLPAAWRFRREWQGRELPAPAQLVSLASLAPPQQSVPPNGCDIACGLEFSGDGRLLASAGILKQVGARSAGRLGQRVQVHCSRPAGAMQ